MTTETRIKDGSFDMAAALGQHPSFKPAKKTKTKRVQHEDIKVLKPAVKFLRLALDPINTVFFHCPNESVIQGSSGKRKAVGANLRAKGLTSGIPDLIIITRGFKIGAEAKWGKNKLSENQELIKSKWLKAGGQWITFYSPEQLEQELRVLGVPLRATLGTKMRD